MDAANVPAGLNDSTFHIKGLIQGERAFTGVEDPPTVFRVNGGLERVIRGQDRARLIAKHAALFIGPYFHAGTNIPFPPSKAGGSPD